MALSWVSVSATDGSVIADLPTLTVGGALKRTIGRYESQTAAMPLDKAPANWPTATRNKAVFLVALDEMRGTGTSAPIWGGMVTERTEDEGSTVELSLVTAEDYFNDRYVGDEAFDNIPQNTIVRRLVEKYAAAGGIPIRVVELPGPNPVREQTYEDAADKTLYSALDELSGLLYGPEWTIVWEWVGDRLGLVLIVGARIGSPAPTGLGPPVQFHLPGSVQKISIVDSYKRGDGANDVMATSTAGGDDQRPQSPRQVLNGDGRPKVEHRWSPDTSITADEDLAGPAQRALTTMQDGTVALSITAARENAPRIGREWDLGDDIGFDLTTRARPAGIVGTARVMSVEITDTTIVPVLDVTHIEGIS